MKLLHWSIMAIVHFIAMLLSSVYTMCIISDSQTGCLVDLVITPFKHHPGCRPSDHCWFTTRAPSRLLGTFLPVAGVSFWAPAFGCLVVCGRWTAFSSEVHHCAVQSCNHGPCCVEARLFLSGDSCWATIVACTLYPCWRRGASCPWFGSMTYHAEALINNNQIFVCPSNSEGATTQFTLWAAHRCSRELSQAVRVYY